MTCPADTDVLYEYIAQVARCPALVWALSPSDFRPGASLVCGIVAFCLGATALLGLPLGLAAWALARSDLTRMRGGLMDPAGWGDTVFARESGRVGALLSAVYLVFWGAVLLLC